MKDLDFVLQNIKTQRSKKKAEVKEYVTRIIDGQEFKVPVYGEGKVRPQTYGKVRGKMTSDAKLVQQSGITLKDDRDEVVNEKVIGQVLR